MSIVVDTAMKKFTCLIYSMFNAYTENRQQNINKLP